MHTPPTPQQKLKKKKKNALNWFICVRKLMYSEIVPDYIFVRVCIALQSRLNNGVLLKPPTTDLQITDSWTHQSVSTYPPTHWSFIINLH